VTTVFVDTVAWIALANTRDALHDSAKDVFNRLCVEEALFVTSEFVLLEFANSLSAPDFRAGTSRFISSLYGSEVIEIVPSSSELFNDGLVLFGQRPDKGWSLVDCISFVIMKERKITTAFSQDHHFEQAGFVKLL